MLAGAARLIRERLGAVAPTVALSLFALLGMGGIAFDYARLASMDTELQTNLGAMEHTHAWTPATAHPDTVPENSATTGVSA
jgi:hypothetical protein